MNITKAQETKNPIIDSLLSIPGMLRASDLELKPRREGALEDSSRKSDEKKAVTVRRQSANDDLYQDSPQDRIERIKKLIRTPVASAVLEAALDIESLKVSLGKGQTDAGRSWAAILHEAARQAVVGGRISALEADLVRLGVVLAGLQQLISSVNSGEDEDLVYRESKAARERLMELDPEAGVWLQHTLGRGLSDEDLTDKAKYLQALVRQAGHLIA